MILIVGCSNNQNLKSTGEIEDNYSNVREIAWNFLKEKGWHDKAEEDWEAAAVSKATVDENYELFDERYRDKEVLSVSFEDKENVVVGTPLILVDADINEVIGYMPME